MLWKGFPDEGFLPRELKEAGLIRKGVREEHCRQRGRARERLLTGQSLVVVGHWEEACVSIGE